MIDTMQAMERMEARVRMLEDALATLLDTALCVDDIEWSRAVERAFERAGVPTKGVGPCDQAARALAVGFRPWGRSYRDIIKNRRKGT